MHDLVRALNQECGRVARLLDALEEADFARATRCPPMRLLELVAHTLRGGFRISEMLAAGPVDAEPEKDGETYFRFGAPATSGVVERAFEAAKDLAGASVADRWKDIWSDVLGQADAALADDDLVYASILGLMKLSEYLRTRVVEVVVHHMDMRDALGLEPDPDPEALDVTCRVLAGLLGTDPRTLGMDGVRFALAGTGRLALNDQESSLLGPLSANLPVFS